MASATKTYSGDLSTAIVGKISDAIENYRQAKEIEKSKASPEVKAAANKLLRKDDDAGESVTKDIDLKSYISKVFGTELDASIIQTEDKVSKLSDQVLSVGESIINTQKLVINHSELMESKFDEIIGIFKKKDSREEAKADEKEAGKTELGMETRDDNFGTQKASKAFSGDLSTSTASSMFGLINFIRGISRGKGPLSKRIMDQLLNKNRFTRGLNSRFNRPYVNPRLTTSGARVTTGSNMFTRAWSKVPKFGLGGGPKVGGVKGPRGAGPLSFLFTALDFVTRLKSGQSLTQAGIGSGSSLLGATGGGALGWKLGAIIGTAIAPGPGTLIGGGIGMTIFSILGGMLGGNIGDNLSGVNKPQDFETGTELQPSFTNNFFEKSVVSSAMLIASAAGVAPEVNAEIRSSGLGHIPVENLNIRPDIGNISKAFSNNTISRSNLVSEVIPSLPPLPGSSSENGVPDKEPWKIFGMDLPDLGITEFLGGAISTARDIVWGRKDDGYWGPKWLGWKRKNKDVEPKTTITGQITDPEELAFLKMVRTVEGTIGPDGYNTWAGTGRNEMDMTSMTLSEVYDEQTRRLNSGEATFMMNGKEETSAAVGAGQFLNPFQVASDMYLKDPKYVPKKWDPDNTLFSKELQIDMMLFLAKKTRGIDVSEPLTLKGIKELEKEWAGIGPHHGQTTRTVEESLQLYNQFLKQIEMTPIEDRKVSQINSTSSEVEESLDSSGGGQTIIIANTTYVSGNNSSSLPVIAKGDNDWVKKYKLYSLAS